MMSGAGAAAIAQRTIVKTHSSIVASGISEDRADIMISGTIIYHYNTFVFSGSIDSEKTGFGTVKECNGPLSVTRVSDISPQQLYSLDR